MTRNHAPAAIRPAPSVDGRGRSAVRQHGRAALLPTRFEVQRMTGGKVAGGASALLRPDCYGREDRELAD